jgi:two-component system phosphate regulon sensor histidine kinase PhoR
MAIVLGVSGVWLQAQLEARFEESLESKLEEHVRALREFVQVAPQLDGIDVVDPLADRMGRAMGVRVTVIDETGRVLGDSDVARDVVASMENHASRQECLGTETGEIGRGRRYSTTLEADMIYVATRYVREDGSGFVRVSMPVQAMNELAMQVKTLLLVASVLAVFIALVVSGIGTQIVLQRLRRLVSAARALTHRAIESRMVPEGGDELGILAQSLDHMSTDLERLLNTLARERDQFGGVLEGMQDGVIAIDSAKSITIINESAKTLLGVSEELVGRPISEVSALSFLEPLLGFRLVERTSGEFELGGVPPRVVLARMTPLVGSGGAVIVAHDITEVRKLEGMRRDFVGNVSHELRTPVSVIRANAETLLDGALTDEKRARSFIEAVLRNSERLSNLIADLLDLSRIEAGHYNVQGVSLVLSALATRVVDSVGQKLSQKEMSVEVFVDDAVEVWADAQALEQVLLNLVENAVKYTPAGGSLCVRASPSDERVRIEVQDDGPGIAAEHRARLFERFYRVDPGRSKEMGGTGLGLAIVKHLVGAMNGEVGMEPAEPSGSIFWVDLPKAG